MSPVAPVLGRSGLADFFAELLEVGDDFVVGGDDRFSLFGANGEEEENKMLAGSQLEETPVDLGVWASSFNFDLEVISGGSTEIGPAVDTSKGPKT